jgi:hypothetical protein
MRKKMVPDVAPPVRVCIGNPSPPDNTAVDPTFKADGAARPRTVTLDVWVCPTGNVPGDDDNDKKAADVPVDDAGEWTAEIDNLDTATDYTLSVTLAGQTTALDSVGFTTSDLVVLARKAETHSKLPAPKRRSARVKKG